MMKTKSEITWNQFARKVKGILVDTEPISLLKFTYEGEEYQVKSQWSSGKNGEYINLWGTKTNRESDRIYPFASDVVKKLKFYK